MSNDPAFLFYPGDYLRDTQCLSEKAQVAYDRIICEHMRNICIRQKQLNFFIKRLSEEEKEEVMMVLTKTDGGYQIRWVAESITKRRAYSESRRQNRQKDSKHICKTHDEHMDNAIENENIRDKDIIYSICEKELSKIAKPDTIRKVLKQVHPKFYWVVDKWFRKRYPADDMKAYKKIVGEL